MPRRALGALCAGVMLASLLAAPALAQTIGVVLLHGKAGAPGQMRQVATTLRAAGILTVAPEMGWSKNRIYDADYEASLAEIDAAVMTLRAMGATRIYVGGRSQGANAALGYAARRSGVAGAILLAPGHGVGMGLDRLTAASRERARRLIAQGEGDRPARFVDVNQGREFEVTATPRVYLSWFDPSGPAVMTANADASPAGVAVFCAEGDRERRPRCGPIMARLRPSPAHAQIRVAAKHSGVADAARDALRDWLLAR